LTRQEMNINRNNYEVYMIDYFDGKLNPVQTAELMYFLNQNPDLENEFNAFENVRLPSASFKFYDKDNLKRNFSDFPAVTDNNFDEFCIAEIEGDLEESSQARLYQYLDKYPHKRKDLELYRKTRLKPDESVVFPGLNQLKKHKLVPYRKIQRIFYAGIAAAVLLVVFLTFIFRSAPDSELITSMIPASENEINTNESVAIQTEKEKIPLNKTNDFRNSNIKKAIQSDKMISFNNIIGKPATRDKIEPSDHIIKPIEIQKIDDNYHPSDIALLKKDQPAQDYTEKPVRKDKSLAEFIKEKLSAQEIARSKENLNVWTFAEASLKGINYLTESDVQMSRKLNIKGEMSEFSIASESFSFSTQLKK
jgi:hypothetical protein